MYRPATPNRAVHCPSHFKRRADLGCILVQQGLKKTTPPAKYGILRMGIPCPQERHKALIKNEYIDDRTNGARSRKLQNLLRVRYACTLVRWQAPAIKQRLSARVKRLAMAHYTTPTCGPRTPRKADATGLGQEEFKPASKGG